MRACVNLTAFVERRVAAGVRSPVSALQSASCMRHCTTMAGASPPQGPQSPQGAAASPHVDSDTMMPSMVDVSTKVPTLRTAVAKGRLMFPPSVAAAVMGQQQAPSAGSSSGPEFCTKKGPVFATATVAATMAAKDTSRMIPFCHPLPLSRCRVQWTLMPQAAGVEVSIEVATHAPTGVEMEALTAVSAGLLTVYDMVKGIPDAQPGLTIEGVQLVYKRGGKSDVGAAAATR